MNVYEVLGRKQEALEALNAEYDRLLVLLSGVVSGEITPARVQVDLGNRSWTLHPPSNGDAPTNRIKARK